MLHLANDQLRVEVLDPTANADLLGPRFCAGAFIWQIHDQQAGPLLSGPEGPEPRPDPFNGHGLPEACRDRGRDGTKWLWRGEIGFVPGVGTLGRGPDGVMITAPAVWHVNAGPTQLEFRSRHAAAGFDAELTRTLSLSGRTLRSHSKLTNHADTPLALEWFAHPFFALDPDHRMTVRLPATATLPPESGFVLADRNLTPARRYVGKDDGAFVLLGGVDDQPLDATISHPALRDGIRFRTDFVPSECPIWMNGFTFSIEPYQRLQIAPGASQTWELTYDFSPPSSAGPR